MSGIKRQRIAEDRSTTSEAKPALPFSLLSSRHPRIEIGRVPEPSRLSAILMPPVIKTISPIQLQKSEPGCSYSIGRKAQTMEMAGNHVVEAWLFSCFGTFDISLFQLQKVGGPSLQQIPQLILCSFREERVTGSGAGRMGNRTGNKKELSGN